MVVSAHWQSLTNPRVKVAAKAGLAVVATRHLKACPTFLNPDYY